MSFFVSVYLKTLESFLVEDVLLSFCLGPDCRSQAAPPPIPIPSTTTSASPAMILLHPLQLLSTPTSSVLVGNEQQVEYLLDAFCLTGEGFVYTGVCCCVLNSVSAFSVLFSPASFLLLYGGCLFPSSSYNWKRFWSVTWSVLFLHSDHCEKQTLSVGFF